MKTIILMFVVSIVLGAVRQARGEEPAAKTSDPSSPLVKGNNWFAIDLYRQLAAQSSGETSAAALVWMN